MRNAHGERPPMPTITPNEAAKRTGRSRRTVMRAIEGGELQAHRDNRNQWQIDEDGLAQWARNEHSAPVAHPAPTAHEAVLEERIRGLEALLAEMRQTNAELRTANDDLRADRDRWAAYASRPWWRRLAG